MSSIEYPIKIEHNQVSKFTLVDSKGVELFKIDLLQVRPEELETLNSNIHDLVEKANLASKVFYKG